MSEAVVESRQTPHIRAGEINTSPLVPMFVVFVVAFLGLGGFGVWASLAPLAGGTVVEGKVAVPSNRKTVQHLEGGIIDDILVQEGATVAAGQSLVRLDDTRARVSHDLLKTRLVEAQARDARLVAERDGLNAPRFPVDLIESNAPLVVGFLAAQRQQFEARRHARMNEAEILRQRVQQLEKQVEGFDVQINAKRGQLALIKDEHQGLSELFQKGFAPRTRVLELEREALRLEGDLGQHISDKSQTMVAQGETRLQIIQLDRSFHEQVVEELRQVRTEIFDSADRLEGAADVLTRNEIKAPIAGKVVGLRVFTRGGVIQPGQPLMDIVPGDEQLVVRAMVKPSDIDHVYPGLDAEVRFTAFDRQKTASMYGKVSRVSADALSDPKGQYDFYEAEIVIDEDELGRLGELTLVPGMPAEVMIKRTERTLVNYLMAPIANAVTRGIFAD